MLVRVICKDGSCGSIEGCNMNDFIRTGKIAAFFCPHSSAWVDVGHGLCADCRMKHPGDCHTCFVHLEQRCEDD